jgi:hypothetical protein
MSTVTPPPPPTPPSPPASGAPTVTVPAPPPALAALAAGARLEAQVLAQLAGNQVQLQTPLGTLTAQTAQPLPPNALLGLVVQPKTPQLKLQIVTIDGKPAAQVLAQAGKGGEGATPAGPTAAGGTGTAAPTGQPTVALTAGSFTVATVLRPPAGAIGRLDGIQAPTPTGQAPGPGPLAPQPTPGTRPAPSPGTPAVDGSTPRATPAGAPPSPAAPGSPSPPDTAGAKPASPSFPPRGAELPVRVLNVAPPQGESAPGIPRTAPISLSPGTRLPAVVTQTTPGGTAVLATQIGELELAVRTPLPRGTELSLELTGPATTRAPSPAPAVTPAAMIMAGDWPALRGAIEALAQADPPVAQHLLNHVVARPDGQLASSLLFFLSALRGGDIRSWVGEGPLRVLERVRGDLARRLGDDFTGFQRVADTTPGTDWRSYLIPFHTGQDIDPIRLHVRPDGGGDDDEEGKAKGTRFLVDITLSRLGRIQLDGLIRKGERQLDLIVRSDSPFPARMRADILTIYANSADVTGMKGGLNFQANPPRFVDVVATDPAGHKRGDGGVLV